MLIVISRSMLFCFEAVKNVAISETNSGGRAYMYAKIGIEVVRRKSFLCVN